MLCGKHKSRPKSSRALCVEGAQPLHRADVPKAASRPLARRSCRTLGPANALASPLRCRPPASSRSARLHLSSLLGSALHPRASTGRLAIRIHGLRAHTVAHFSSFSLTGALRLARRPHHTRTAAQIHRRTAQDRWHVILSPASEVVSPKPNPHYSHGQAGKVPHGFHLGHTRVA